jgi:hypothetical protein
MNLLLGGVCRADHTNMIVGSACPMCGHASILHRGCSNPYLSGCVLCELEELKEDLQSVIRDSRRRPKLR